MASMPYSEFLKWVWVLEWEESEAPATRLEYCLAQIVSAIEHGPLKHPRHTGKCLLKFTMTDQEMPADPAARVTNSKAYWMTLAKYGGTSPQRKGTRKRALPAKVRQATQRRKTKKAKAPKRKRGAR